MLMYIKPQIEILKAEFILMSGSGPNAGDIGSPNVRNNSKSIWDEEESDTYYNNIKEEQDYED